MRRTTASLRLHLDRTLLYPASSPTHHLLNEALKSAIWQGEPEQELAIKDMPRIN